MNRKIKGSLKIFFSYAESIGKTQAMLKAAEIARNQGLDVVIGYISAHTPEQLAALPAQLERLDPGSGAFDIDLALERKPELLLLDELACTNGPGYRHKKRYQEVYELLNAGIDVYTTVNVGNIESLHDVVASVTGITTWERIPDAVFDEADQVELIDIEPQELISRLNESDTAESRLTVEQLTALREIALRRCADRVKRLSSRLQVKKTFHTDEHILACLSSAPSNGKIIRTAALMAKAFNSQFTALFVETPDFAAATEENKQRLSDNRKLAEQLGASVETVYGDDVPYQIAEFARLSGVTKIVLGRSAMTRKHLLGKPTLTEQLLSYVPELDIHIIPDRSADTPYKPRKAIEKRHVLRSILISAGFLLGATLLSLLFRKLGFTESNIIMVYILGVLLTSITTSHQVYSLVSSVASVCIFNYLFTEPRFTLMAYGTGYPVTFLTMFLTAYITGNFATRYKAQASQAAKIARRTKILFDADQLLSKAQGKDEILRTMAEQLQKLLERNIVIYENLNGLLSAPCFYQSGEPGAHFSGYEVEHRAAEWVLENNHIAGATTDTHSDAQYMYLALRVNERVYGVVGVDVRDAPLDASAHGMLLSILGEAALALENEKNAREKEAAAILAESEQLRANLLRTISHDLRTPLTSISGHASNLMMNSAGLDEETKQQLYADIYSDSMWLIELVENLLYATRIEEGRMTLNTSTESLSEIVEEAARRIGRKTSAHTFTASCENDYLLVRADAKLIVQVITNIVDNAVKYTPPGTAISLKAGAKNGKAEIVVADTGNGVPDEVKTKIFEKFYCGTNKIADNRRSLGLGLYLCKAIVEAHGGELTVADNVPHGAVFCFTLPLEEVSYHE